MRSEQVSKILKLANGQPVPKKGGHTLLQQPYVMYSMERGLNSSLFGYLESNDLLSDRHFGFHLGTGDFLAFVTHIKGEAVWEWRCIACLVYRHFKGFRQGLA